LTVTSGVSAHRRDRRTGRPGRGISFDVEEGTWQFCTWDVQSRHDSGERLRGFTAGSVRTYLSAVWWLS